MIMSADRREFLRFVISGSVLGGNWTLQAATGAEPPHVRGETYEICHRLRDGGEFPPPSRHGCHDVVIVGGGLSGLTAAYRLRDRDVLILEKEPDWGGNAQFADDHGQRYALGAAFLESHDAAGELRANWGSNRCRSTIGMGRSFTVNLSPTPGVRASTRCRIPGRCGSVSTRSAGMCSPWAVRTFVAWRTCHGRDSFSPTVRKCSSGGMRTALPTGDQALVKRPRPWASTNCAA